jgi:hypothetical protein
MEYKNEETDVNDTDNENDKDSIEKSDKEKMKENGSEKGSEKGNKDDVVESVTDVKEVRKVKDLGLQSLNSIINAQVFYLNHHLKILIKCFLFFTFFSCLVV